MRDKRRLIEWGKNALIVLLTASAVWLLTMTPLVQDSGLLDLLAPQESPGVGSGGGGQGTAMLPVRLAITGAGGRCGVQYDEDRLEELFPPLGALLGDALASAETPQPLSEEDWRGYLRGTGIYFDFGGGVPLSALERWLQGPGNGTLTGSARRVLLCAGTDGQVLLCWQEAEGGGFFTCRTGLTQDLHLEPAAEGAAFNGAYFAFEDQELSRGLAPYTLITEGEQGGTEYAVSSPLAGEGGPEAVLSALSFSSQDHAPVSGGEVYVDGGDRLVLNAGGTVTYRAGQGEKYPAGPTLADGVDAARALAEAALGPMCGEARLYLMSAQNVECAVRVRFGYLLDGCAVYLGSEGWAAEFWIWDGCVTQFTLRFRSYAASGEETLLLPVDMAAAMLPDLTWERRELVIQYRDGGGTEAVPGWVAV